MDKIYDAILKFPNIQEHGIWAMCNLLKGEPFLEWEKVSKGLVILKQVITDSEDESVIANTLWAISYIVSKILIAIL